MSKQKVYSVEDVIPFEDIVSDKKDDDTPVVKEVTPVEEQGTGSDDSHSKHKKAKAKKAVTEDKPIAHATVTSSVKATVPFMQVSKATKETLITTLKRGYSTAGTKEDKQRIARELAALGYDLNTIGEHITQRLNEEYKK